MPTRTSATIAAAAVTRGTTTSRRFLEPPSSSSASPSRRVRRPAWTGTSSAGLLGEGSSTGSWLMRCQTTLARGVFRSTSSVESAPRQDLAWIWADPRRQCYDEWSSGSLMTDILSKPVLVLNRVFAPVQLTTVKRAFVLLYGGAAKALDEQGEEYDFDLWRELPVRDEDDSLAIVG